MTITVQANDVNDARHQLGLLGPRAQIYIRFRDGHDYGRIPVTGAIVDAVASCPIFGAVPMEFDSAAGALRHLSKILKHHDKFAREQAKRLGKQKKAPVA